MIDADHLHAATAPVGTCANCGAILQGAYCHDCGERRRDPRDLRLRSFVGSALSGALDVDGRLLRTFHAVVMRPGLLTAEWMQGRRVRWLGPVQLFLLVNLVFFAAQSVIGGQQTFTTRLQYHVAMAGYGDAAARLVDARATPGTPDRVEYDRRFDEATPRYANSMVILVVPLFALVLAALFAYTGTPFVQHVVLSLHFIAFVLVVTLLVPLVLAPLVLLAPGVFGRTGEFQVSLAFLSAMALWLGVGFRRLYGGSVWAGVMRGVLAAVLMMPVLLVYRMILFFTVYYAVR